MLAVEPKHIAAALRSDPVIPLVGIEAVIRQQAGEPIRLTPDSSIVGTQQQPANNQRQDQQCQPARSSATGSAAAASQPSSNTPGDNSSVYCNRHNAILALRFVQSILCALHHLLELSQHFPATALSAGYQDTTAISDLATRLFSISTTACKTMQAAVCALAESDKVEPGPSDAITLSQIPEAAAFSAVPTVTKPQRTSHQHLLVWLTKSGLNLYTIAMEVAYSLNPALLVIGHRSIGLSIVPVCMFLQGLGGWAAALSSEHPAFRIASLKQDDHREGSVDTKAATASESSEARDRLLMTIENVGRMSFWAAAESATDDEVPYSFTQHKWQNHMKFHRVTLVEELKGLTNAIMGSNAGLKLPVAACRESSPDVLGNSRPKPLSRDEFKDQYGNQLQAIVSDLYQSLQSPTAARTPAASICQTCLS